MDKGEKPLFCLSWGANAIAKALNERGIESPLKASWNGTQITKMLKNEKYCGDWLLQKTFFENGVKRYNLGEKTSYYVENNHEAIIERECFEKVKEVMESRANKKLRGGRSIKHPFSGLILCGICGNNYKHKVNNSGTPSQTGFWNCHKVLSKGVASCGNTGIKDSVIEEKFVEAYNEFIMRKYVCTAGEAMHNRLKTLYGKERELVALRNRGLISKASYAEEHAALRQEISACEIEERRLRLHNLSEKDYKTITEFQEEKVQDFITRVIIQKWTVTFEFYNGILITKTYTNGKPGNIHDWQLKRKKGGN